jgi:hypothetical protein
MSKREHKEAVEFALGSRGALISKEEFDRLVKPAAVAPAANGPAGSPNAATAALKYDELFQLKEEEAAKRVVELQVCAVLSVVYLCVHMYNYHSPLDNRCTRTERQTFILHV